MNKNEYIKLYNAIMIIFAIIFSISSINSLLNRNSKQHSIIIEQYYTPDHNKQRIEKYTNSIYRIYTTNKDYKTGATIHTDPNLFQLNKYKKQNDNLIR